MAQGITHLSADTFDEMIQGADTPVLVDFWAEWCGPCKKIAPILEELAAEIGDQVAIAKVNVDDHPAVAQRFHVMSIPTLVLFQGGEVRKEIVGARGKPQLLQELDEFLVSAH